jgi:hypothetical protein
MSIKARRRLVHPNTLLTRGDAPSTGFRTTIQFVKRGHHEDGRSINHILSGVNAICLTVSVFLTPCGIMTRCSPVCSVIQSVWDT